MAWVQDWGYKQEKGAPWCGEEVAYTHPLIMHYEKYANKGGYEVSRNQRRNVSSTYGFGRASRRHVTFSPCTVGSRSDSRRQYRSCSIEIQEISSVHTNLPFPPAQQRACNIPTKDSECLFGSLLYGYSPTKNCPLTPQCTFPPPFHFLISKETVSQERW